MSLTSIAKILVSLYLRLFKAMRFFKPLLPPLEVSCLDGLDVVVNKTAGKDVVDTAAVILSRMCSLMLIKFALSGVLGGGGVVVGLLCLLSSR